MADGVKVQYIETRIDRYVLSSEDISSGDGYSLHGTADVMFDMMDRLVGIVQDVAHEAPTAAMTLRIVGSTINVTVNRGEVE